MYDACNSNEGTTVGALVDVIVPGDDGEGVEGNAPIEFGAELVEFLLLLLDAALGDGVGGEGFEVVG